MRNIAILTSGGDAPGMNACVRAVVRTGLSHNINVIGIRRGYDGLLAFDYTELRARDVGGIIQRGGTILQTARSQRFLTDEGHQTALKNLNRARIEGLIVVGGDGSLRGALKLHQLGFPVIGIPASIDNDIHGTDTAIGVDTALNTIIEAVDKLRDTASSHERAFFVETMGRRSGYLAVMSGVVCGAELVLIPEVDIPREAVAEAIAEAFTRKKTHAIILVAEGAQYNAAQIATWLEENAFQIKTRVTVLGHIQRGGRPTAADRLLAARLGYAAMEGMLSGQRGVMVAVKGNQIAYQPLEAVGDQQRAVDLDYYELARVLAQ